MKRFEYKISKYDCDLLGLKPILNEMGNDGWELVAIKDEHWIFKRERTPQKIHGPG